MGITEAVFYTVITVLVVIGVVAVATDVIRHLYSRKSMNYELHLVDTAAWLEAEYLKHGKRATSGEQYDLFRTMQESQKTRHAQERQTASS